MKKSAGFTWIETIVILAIIGTLVLIALPNLRQQGILKNEASIREDLRYFSTANQAYFSGRKPRSYAASIDILVKPEDGPSRLGESWEKNVRGGYRVAYQGGGKAHPDSYALKAEPIIPNQTAINTYCIDQTGILKGSIRGDNPPAGSTEGCVGGAATIM